MRKGFFWGFSALFLGIFLLKALYAAEDYTHEEYLLETDELSKIIQEQTVRLIDAEEPAIYQRAHIPGAVNIPRPSLADIKARRETGYPVSKEEAEKILGEAGIDADTKVIVYDGGEGPNASGVWFVLTFFGHREVKVLNGGFRKWLKEGRPVTQEVPQIEKKQFLAKPQPALVITSEGIMKNKNNNNFILMDSRSFKEYIGEELRAGVARGGHLPGAVHLEWVKVSEKGMLDTFKKPGELEKVFTGRGISKDKEIVTYCQTGIGRATDLFLALKLLGYDNIRVYTGSWEDWGNDPALPIEK